MTETANIAAAGLAAQHRRLRLASIAELRREVGRLAAAERAGTLRRAGNWAAGQTFGHLATWINFAYDGYPPTLRPPWFIKLLMRLGKRKFLRGPLPRGVRIPGAPGGTLGTEELPLDEAVARLEAALDRLEAGPPGQPNPIFGVMSHEEWKQAQLRHAELHLGYLVPQE